eukprot:CAMPEP_0197865766 /NCGR_PEP_ID=MMETSP1438-20131217/43847_1 /TAXON_ID=1461541 /ORGANISM="Pterosperma sp., Strain CCMP1384" /LENGTH=125 /DNA_ID=CAMNT_0043484265 /DNA_START=677 /DNA_END=1054 /DNA_ORIENTATION=-
MWSTSIRNLCSALCPPLLFPLDDDFLPDADDEEDDFPDPDDDDEDDFPDVDEDFLLPTPDFLLEGRLVCDQGPAAYDMPSMSVISSMRVLTSSCTFSSFVFDFAGSEARLEGISGTSRGTSEVTL